MWFMPASMLWRKRYTASSLAFKLYMVSGVLKVIFNRRTWWYEDVSECDDGESVRYCEGNV